MPETLGYRNNALVGNCRDLNSLRAGITSRRSMPGQMEGPNDQLNLFSSTYLSMVISILVSSPDLMTTPVFFGIPTGPPHIEMS